MGSMFLSWFEARIQEGIEPSSRFYLYIQNSCRSAADTTTYLELVGPLRLRSDERNGDSGSDDETVGEMHVTIKGLL
jgi:hypothetical protein